jgi:iron complex transport system permease protein
VTLVVAGDERSSTTNPAVWGVFAATLFASVTLAVMIGPVAIRPATVWRVTIDHLVPGWLSPTWQPFEQSIVWDVRLPRVLLAAITGAGLAVVGATLQALLRNPLADPYLLGTSSGAALGAVGVLLFGASAIGGVSVSIAAFVGALVAIAMVYVLAWQDGRFPTARLLLGGVAVSYRRGQRCSGCLARWAARSGRRWACRRPLWRSPRPG